MVLGALTFTLFSQDLRVGQGLRLVAGWKKWGVNWEWLCDFERGRRRWNSDAWHVTRLLRQLADSADRARDEKKKKEVSPSCANTYATTYVNTTVVKESSGVHGWETKRLWDCETKKVQSSKYRVQSWMKDKETKGLRMRKFHFIPFGFNIVSNSYGILSSVGATYW